MRILVLDEDERDNRGNLVICLFSLLFDFTLSHAYRDMLFPVGFFIDIVFEMFVGGF